MGHWCCVRNALGLNVCACVRWQQQADEQRWHTHRNVSVCFDESFAVLTYVYVEAVTNDTIVMVCVYFLYILCVSSFMGLAHSNVWCVKLSHNAFPKHAGFSRHPALCSLKVPYKALTQRAAGLAHHRFTFALPSFQYKTEEKVPDWIFLNYRKSCYMDIVLSLMNMEWNYSQATKSLLNDFPRYIIMPQI